MRRLFTLFTLALPGLVFAQVTHQSVTMSPTGEKRIIRQVLLKDEHGSDILVEQHLTELENGNYLYIREAQPQATRELEDRICASFGSAASKGAVSTWSPGTLGGGSCQSSQAKDLDDAPKPQAKAPRLNVIAPGNYVVPSNQNSYHRGVANYEIDAASTITNELVIDGRCQESSSDFAPGPGPGNSQLYVACFMPTPGTAPTYMKACIGGQCATDRNTITVF